MGALSDLMKGKTSVQPQKKIGGLKGLLEQSKKKPVPQARPITQAQPFQPTQPVQPVLPSYVKNTLPRDLGGGSYYSTPGQPNQLIRPEAKKTYGSLPVKQGQQRDHFIAQSLGGASDDYNLNYVPSEVNQKWGNIETRNLNAYKRGDISLPQARLNVLKEKQEWLLKQKGISQSVKDNLIQIAKDPINPVNIVKGVLKKITSPLSLVKEYAKAIAPKQIAELEQTKAPDNKSMRFEVSNVEKVLPGPRISTLNAIQQGAKIEPVKVGEAPVISPERQIKTQLADEAGYRKEITGGLSSMTPKEAGVGALQALAGGVRATSDIATLPITATANLLSKEKVPLKTLVDTTLEMAKDDIKTGGRASTGKAAQMYLQSRGVGKYGGNEVNIGDIAVLATIGLGDTMGDPIFYYGMVKPALNQLKFATQFKKVGDVALKAKPGVKIINPQKSIINISDDLKIVVNPKTKGVTFKGYARRGATGDVLNQKAIAGVVDDISRQTGVQMSGQIVGNDIVLTSKATLPSVAKATTAKVAPTVLPKAEIKPQKAQGDVLPTKTTKADPLNFKTAEDYVKAQGQTFYRGTYKPQVGSIKEADTYGLAYGKGVYVTPNIDFAKSYGDNITEMTVNLKKPFNMADTVSDSVINKFKKDLPEYADYVEYGMKGEDLWSAIPNADEANNYLKSLGYDGLVDAAKGTGADQTILFNVNGIKTKSQLISEWNKAQPLKTKVSPEVKPALKSAKLDTLNPTGSVFADYTPAKRATAELADNITTLDKTMKKPADEMITIYRGTSKGGDIVAGDFVTTNKQLAKDYAGTGQVIEKKVRLSDVLDDLDEPLGEEYIYRPQAKLKPSVEPLIQEAKKYKTADEFIKAQGTPVYHGTQAKFNKFDSKFATDAEGRKLNLGWGKGNFYFTTKKGEALKYATRERSPEVAKLYPKGEPNVIEAFVDIKKPFDIEIGKNAERWRKVRDGYWTDGVSDFNYHKIPKGKTKAEAFVEQLKKEGYDGIIDGQEITAFSENSIKTKSQLTDIWNKANKSTLPKPKKQPIKYVPVEKPVDLRKKITTERIVAKPSIPQRIKAETIKSGLEDVFGDIEYYNKVSVKSQADETAKLINEDYDRAVRIAMGQENAPGDLLPESVLIGVKNQAIKSGDTELLINLATAEGGVARESTVLGQRIKMLDEGLEDDAFRNIKKVVSERRNNYQKKTGKSVDKAIKQETDKIKEAIKKTAPKADAWVDFVNSITC